jgi:SAM-dependent methyltransferase
MTDERESKLHAEAYYQYLRKRSLAGYLYRKYLLYPRLCRKLTGSVLDYGCGIGDFVRSRPNTIGVDINSHNVDYCKQHGMDARLIVGNQIPFADGSFDGVMLDNVLEHIPSSTVDFVIREIGRMLKVGGNVLVGVPGTKGYRSDPDHKVYYTSIALSDLFSRHGFETIEVFFMPLPFKKLDNFLSQFCVYVLLRKS